MDNNFSSRNNSDYEISNYDSSNNNASNDNASKNDSSDNSFMYPSNYSISKHNTSDYEPNNNPDMINLKGMACATPVVPQQIEAQRSIPSAPVIYSPADPVSDPHKIGQEPEIMTNEAYTPAYLRNFIGKLMRVEFLLGDSLTGYVGRLLKVGASYIVLQSIDPSSIIMCDLSSIKFATILKDSSPEPPMMM